MPAAGNPAPSAVLDRSTLLTWAHLGLVSLGRARARIDALNVFPVPDGDTGTNLYLTVEAAVAAADAEGSSEIGAVARSLARGALLGARGNSGVILSQIVRGMCDEFGRDEVIDGPSLARALTRAADAAYAAVERPLEGTILTVARQAADSATAAAADGGAGLIEVISAARAGSHAALAATTGQLEALRRAGVVDAGAAGLVVLIDALEEVLTGVHRGDGEADTLAAAVPAEPHDVDDATYDGPPYEVMFLLDANDEAVATLRSELGALGDSLVVVGGDGIWNVHVHVDDPGAAIEAAITNGRPHKIRVTHLMSQNGGRRADRVGLRGRGVVVVAHGSGVAELASACGARVVMAQPRTRPSTGELLDAVHATGAGEVVILPSDSDTQAVAMVVASEARHDGIRVAVIPTRSVVQSLAALAVHDSSVFFDSDVVAMTRAASSTRYAALTVAAREAVTSAGICQIGDILGLVEGDIVELGGDPSDVARRVLTRMMAVGGELITMVTGDECDPLMVSELEEWLRHTYVGIDVVTYDGGQPLWPLILGVE